MFLNFEVLFMYEKFHVNKDFNVIIFFNKYHLKLLMIWNSSVVKED